VEKIYVLKMLSNAPLQMLPLSMFNEILASYRLFHLERRVLLGYKGKRGSYRFKDLKLGLQ